MINKTGLSGRFDVDLRYSPQLPNAFDNADSGSSPFMAIQEQLGLRLEATKAPVETLVIDQIERPSDN